MVKNWICSLATETEKGLWLLHLLGQIKSFGERLAKIYLTDMKTMYWTICLHHASCVLVEKWIVLHMPWFIYLRAEFSPSGVRLETVSIGPLLRSTPRGSGVHGALAAALATLESAVDNANALGKNEFRFPLLFIRIPEQNLHEYRNLWRYSWSLPKQLILYEYWKHSEE